jgi:biopolymer transport protein TolQ
MTTGVLGKLSCEFIRLINVQKNNRSDDSIWPSSLRLSPLLILSFALMENEVLNLVLQSGSFAKFIMLALLVLSILAWSITLNKYFQFRSFHRDYQRLTGMLRPNAEPQALYANAVKKHKGPVSRIFEEGYLTLSAAFNQESSNKYREAAQRFSADQTNHSLEQDVKMRLETATTSECTQLESGLSFLASITTVSPFIGLLGTVWGVMGAFLGISLSGNADLSVVAPGIAEALITTVAGLAVAIPAVFCHNFLAARLRLIEDDLDRLSTELNIYFSSYWHREKSKAENRLGHQRDAAR